MLNLYHVSFQYSRRQTAAGTGKRQVGVGRLPLINVTINLSILKAFGHNDAERCLSDV